MKRASKGEVKTKIWNGIVQRAIADGDDRLNGLVLSAEKNVIQYTWIRIAAAILLFLTLGLWLYRQSSHTVLTDKQLASTYQDSTGKSMIRLANGKSVVLNGSSYADSILGLNTDAASGLDYRKLSRLGTKTELHIFETSRGKQDHFTLADGTGVWLNAGSKITFPTRFDQAQRTVELVGEAYFEVAHNKTKPFIVVVDRQRVQVLGTHFNIRSYPDDLKKEVVLLEGSVKVSDMQRPEKEAVLKPAQRLTIADKESYTLDNIANPEFFIAWKDGEFFFQDAQVASLVKELERWYPVHITVSKEDGQKRISGKMRKDWSMKEVKDAFQYFDITLHISTN